jgi:hypothetical protein
LCELRVHFGFGRLRTHTGAFCLLEFTKPPIPYSIDAEWLGQDPTGEPSVDSPLSYGISIDHRAQWQEFLGVGHVGSLSLCDPKYKQQRK